MATPNWLVAVALLAPLAASAQQAEREERMSSSVGLRRDSRLEAVDLAELRRRLLAEVDWKLTLGVAEVRAENGERVTATPFQVRARFNEGRTAFKLSGEGYAWLRSDEGSASGYRDVNAMLTQVVASGTVLEGGMTLPAGGEVGSSHARERVGAIYNHVFSPRWEGQVHGRLTRHNGDPRPGVGRTRSQGLVQAAYNLDTPYSDVLFQLLRSYRLGSASGSAVAVAYEFPLQEKRRPPTGAVSFTRGITSGAHDNTVEFSLSLRL